jgi:casein kinase 1/casein kinase 1 epsilon
VGQNFVIKKRLGSGAFGEIYLGVNMKNNIEVAIKIEPVPFHPPSAAQQPMRPAEI